MKTGMLALGIAGLLALAGTAGAQNNSRVGFGKPAGGFRQSMQSGGGKAARPGAARPSAPRPSAARPSAPRPSAARPSAPRPGAARPSAAPSRIGFGASTRGSGPNGSFRPANISRGGSALSGSNRDRGNRGGGHRDGGRGHGGRQHDGGSRTSVKINIGGSFGVYDDYSPPPRRPVFIDRCDPIVIRRPVIIDDCDPFIVRRPVVVLDPCPPPLVIERPVIVIEDSPDVVTVRGEPAAPEYITQEEWCWRALAEGNPDAMERFGELVARDEMSGTAALGYAICAAAAGQIERADWAASEALQVDAEIARKAPPLPGLKEQIVSALKNYESLATERTPQRAQTISLLKEAAGDDEGARSAAEAMVKLQALAAAKATPVELASAK